jgi:hypothetical protein
MRVYCDTCVYIDALRLGKKSNDRLRPLDEFARSFLTRVDQGEYILVTSDHVLSEFTKVIGSDIKLKQLLDGITNKVHVVKDDNDVKKARELSKTNFPDALHVILALKAGAIIITTRDLDHFNEFRGLIEISLPESL